MIREQTSLRDGRKFQMAVIIARRFLQGVGLSGESAIG
jgi:hypothetical protein